MVRAYQLTNILIEYIADEPLCVDGRERDFNGAFHFVSVAAWNHTAVGKCKRILRNIPLSVGKQLAHSSNVCLPVLFVLITQIRNSSWKKSFEIVITLFKSMATASILNNCIYKIRFCTAISHHSCEICSSFT